MGSGKTTYIKKLINEECANNSNKKYLFVTPYLKQIHYKEYNEEGNVKYECGIIHECPKANFIQPKHLGNGKLENLHDLIINNENIATTHALFTHATDETYQLLKINEYTIIIDEVLQLMDTINISLPDYNMLIEQDKISVNEFKEISWIDKEYKGKFEYLKKLCEKGIVIESIKKDNSKYPVQLLVYNFNPMMFKDYNNQMYILTYLFEGSYMYLYFKAHNIDYEKYTIHNNNLVKYNEKLKINKNNFKDLINIYEGKLNNIGEDYHSLSKTWFETTKNKPLIKQLKKNIFNYLKNINKANSNEIMWTTFKDAKSKLQGNGYTKAFVQCAEKGSNEYGNRKHIVYACNRFFNPDDKIYFKSKGVTVNEDIWALSEMIQFIWRSRIRNGKNIELYIPSSRMRNLLINWLNS